ncbi:MAG TPA: hypothetical protein VMK12_27820 [Anaeromyxobacteraceae bacterium]|nr:hypothetical protein [Anaeromyxobacteraceae bacterium]
MVAGSNPVAPTADAAKPPNSLIKADAGGCFFADESPGRRVGARYWTPHRLGEQKKDLRQTETGLGHGSYLALPRLERTIAPSLYVGWLFDLDANGGSFERQVSLGARLIHDKRRNLLFRVEQESQSPPP